MKRTFRDECGKREVGTKKTLAAEVCGRCYSRFLISASIALIALVVAACSGIRHAPRFTAAPAGKQGPDIRVLLSEGKEAVEIASTGPVGVMGTGGLSLLRSGAAARLSITAEQSMLYFRLEPGGSVATTDGEVFIVSDRGAVLSIEGISYAGRMRVSPSPGGLTVVNVLPLETYLEGVLPHEMGNPGPAAFAALEAQAVAARTYALSKMRARKGEPFDVHASVMDQVYRGREGIFQLASSAVQKTRGRVLVHNEELVRAYYCANCGGHTSDIRRVWPEREPAPYLTGLRDTDAISKETCCREGRRFRWRFSFSGRRLGEIIRRTLPKELGVREEDIGSLRNITILERSASGRVSILEIESAKGVFRVQGDRIRWVLMPDVEGGRILPSTMFDVAKSMEGETVSFVTITGGGNGHGVGMCQAGAIGMSKRGYTCKMILSHYYPGCRIISEY